MRYVFTGLTPGVGELVGLVGLNRDSLQTPHEEKEHTDFMRLGDFNPPNPPNPPNGVDSEEMENEGDEPDGGYDDDGFDFK